MAWRAVVALAPSSAVDDLDVAATESTGRIDRVDGPLHGIVQ